MRRACGRKGRGWEDGKRAREREKERESNAKIGDCKMTKGAFIFNTDVGIEKRRGNAKGGDWNLGVIVVAVGLVCCSTCVYGMGSHSPPPGI